MEPKRNGLERWLGEWRIAINVSKNSAIILARAGRRSIQPLPVTLVGEPIQTVKTIRYLGVTPESHWRSSPAMANSAQRIAFGAYQPSAFRIPWQKFCVIFLNCKSNARVFDADSRHGPHSPLPQARCLHLSAYKKVAFATEAVWAQNPDSQPRKVLSLQQLVQCHLGASLLQEQSRPSAWLQNR